jgi:platelet-activating factor acetylhydrolase
MTAAGILLFLLTTWFTKLPAFRNAQLADYWPPPQTEHRKTKKDWNLEGDPPEGEPSKPIFPLMMFSHGLGGSRVRSR